MTTESQAISVGESDAEANKDVIDMALDDSDDDDFETSPDSGKVIPW